MCDPLWTSVCRSTKSASAWVHVESSQRLGFPCPNDIGILIVVFMFKVYHAMRNEMPLVISQSILDGDFNPILARVRWLVRLYAEENGLDVDVPDVLSNARRRL